MKKSFIAIILVFLCTLGYVYGNPFNMTREEVIEDLLNNNYAIQNNDRGGINVVDGLEAFKMHSLDVGRISCDFNEDNKLVRIHITFDILTTTLESYLQSLLQSMVDMNGVPIYYSDNDDIKCVYIDTEEEMYYSWLVIRGTRMNIYGVTIAANLKDFLN